MSDINTRIEQFKKMANDDPNNELGHYSLGKAYLDARQFDGAIASFDRVIQINPNMSRAYQLAAKALLETGKRELAIAKLTEGVRIAQQRGELMPRNEMVDTLKGLGQTVPDLGAAADSAANRAVGEGEVLCSRCGRVGPRLKDPPFRNAQGKLIQEKICTLCWKEWIGMGTKVINEMRLPLSDPQAQKIFDQHMMEFLNLRP